MTLHATFLQFATFLCSGFHASLLFQSFQSDYERGRVHRGIQQPPCQLVFLFMNQSDRYEFWPPAGAQTVAARRRRRGTAGWCVDLTGAFLSPGGDA